MSACGSTVSILPILFLCGSVVAPTAQAATFTFAGSFLTDDQTALFDVNVGATTAVQIRTYGYAGGRTTDGTIVPAGGFDPILTLFDARGAFLADNDEGTGAPTDPSSGVPGDALLDFRLQPGNYIVGLTQYDNFSVGNLSDGFLEEGNAHFTADPNFSPAGPCPGNLFRDTSQGAGRCRNGNWTVEFVNVASASQRPASAVPEPLSFSLVLSGILATLVIRKSK